ncbi:MAG: hypothetical protein ACKO8N_08650 [Rubrivivax sp.]
MAKLVEVSACLRQAVGYIGTGVDIRLYPRKEFERRSSWTSSAAYAAVNGGRVLFEAGRPDHLACALLIQRHRAAPEAAGRGTDRA